MIPSPTQAAAKANELHLTLPGQVAPDYSALTGYGPAPFTPRPLVRGDWAVIDPSTGKECARALTQAGAVKAALYDGLTAEAVRFVGVSTDQALAQSQNQRAA